ncbi:MAG: hypothetical protein IID37_02585 [Planctomycetes bacterium]|nr:hypothetical protein [Planctomycetota bacterium]
MAKSFYSLTEAAGKLNLSEEQIKDLVRAGKLREFRDAGSVNFKADEVDGLAAASAPDAGASSTGELILEPAEDSAINLAQPSDSDALTLGEVDLDDTASGPAAGSRGQQDKGGSVVASVGVSVFDEEELDKSADPMAETVVAGEADTLGIDPAGSGSGLLDLTRESDDTSLGAELLDEIYPGDEGSVEMGDATRAGLDDAITADDTEVAPVAESFEEAAPGPAVASVARVTRVEYAPDAFSAGLAAMSAITVVVLCGVGVGAAAIVRGVWPVFLDSVYSKLWMFGAGAFVASGLALALGYFVGKRAS